MPASQNMALSGLIEACENESEIEHGRSFWASAAKTSAEAGIADRFSTTTSCIYIGAWP